MDGLTMGQSERERERVFVVIGAIVRRFARKSELELELKLKLERGKRLLKAR